MRKQAEQVGQGRKVVGALTLVLLAVASCSRSPGAAGERDANARSATVVVDAHLVVEHPGDAAAALREQTLDAGGWVERADVPGGDEAAHLDLRVPVARLPGLRAGLARLGVVEGERETSQDVTDRKVDVAAHLRAASAREERLLRLLAERTGTVADVLEVERALAAARDDIEKLQAQQDGLARQVEFATVRVVVERRAPEAWRTPLASLARAGRAGLRGCAAIVVGLSMAAVAALPTLLVLALSGGGLWAGVRALRRRLAR